MSTREMSRKYRAQVPQIYTTPQEQMAGGVGLLDLITGNTPRKLQQERIQGQKDMQMSEHMQEQTMEDIMHSHEKEIIQLQAKIADELKDHDLTRSYATANGIPTRQAAEELAGHAVANAVKKYSLQNATTENMAKAQNPGFNASIGDAYNRGANAIAEQPAVDNIVKQTLNAPMGGIATRPTLNGGLLSATGGVQKQGVEMFGGYHTKGPNGEDIIQGQQALPYTQSTAGAVEQTPPPIKVDPAIRARAMQALNQDSDIQTTPFPSSFGQMFNQGSNIQPQASLQQPTVQPQVQNNALLPTIGRDVGAKLNQIYTGYQDNILSPIYKYLFNNPQTNATAQVPVQQPVDMNSLLQQGTGMNKTLEEMNKQIEAMKQMYGR